MIIHWHSNGHLPAYLLTSDAAADWLIGQEALHQVVCAQAAYKYLATYNIFKG